MTTEEISTIPVIPRTPKPRRKWFREWLGRVRNAPRRTKITWGSVVIVAFLVMLALVAWRRSRPEVLRIAYFGRNANTTLDELHRVVLAKYVSELNGRLDGVRFVVDYFDIKNDPAELTRLY